MSHIDQHAPGTFCWIELSTTGQDAAKTFYSSLFGWSSVDSPMGPGEFYTMFQIEGRDAAGAYTMGADERSQGVPPHWNLYVAVESADDAAARAAKLGGEVLAPPFDVMEHGRMAVLRDPTGAVVSVWQPKKHRGTGIGGVDGTLCWADLLTRDPQRARQFYADLFSWKLTLAEKDSSGYLHIKNDAEFIGGIPPGGPPNPQAPPHWLLYFKVADVDASAAKAKQLGAAVYAPPMTIEDVGRIAVLADPAGAVFSIFKASPRS